MQKTGIRLRGKTPGVKGIELASLAEVSTKPGHEGEMRFKDYH